MSDRKCLEKPRKPLTPLKKLDIIFRRRYVQNTQFYFTNRKFAAPESDEPKTKAAPSFNVPTSEKLLSYIKFCDKKGKMICLARQKQPLHLKDNVRIAGTRDISKRLFIPEPPDDVRCVVEIHPEFYTVIEGRPIRALDDVKVYITNIRQYAMLRQQIGYRRDITIKIGQDMVDEKEEYAKISSNLTSHIVNFQNFLTEDYNKACAKVAKAAKVHAELDEKIAEFLSYAVQITILNNMIFTLDAVRKGLKLYRTFLLFAAPLYWRAEYDETYRSLSFQMSAGEFVISSSEFVLESDLVQSCDIDAIVESAKIEFRNPLPVHMYFKTPDEMMYLFNTMAIQSREYFMQLAKTRDPYKLLLNSIQWLKQSTKLELDSSQYFIDILEREIERELYNEVHFRTKFMRILTESFYDTVASPSSLKLKICIEYVYEQILGKSDEGHQNIHDPMKILEVLYEEFNLKIDGLDFVVVTQARNDIFAQDLAMMNAAYKAQRELKMFKEMTNAMNKAFMPPAKFKKTVFTKFMSKKQLAALKLAAKIEAKLARGERIKAAAYKVTPEQRDDLEFFTEWCDGEDPAPYLRNVVDKYVKPVFLMEQISTVAPPRPPRKSSMKSKKSHA